MAVGEESACNAEEPDSIPGSGRPPGGGRGNLLHTPAEAPWTGELGGPQSMRSQTAGHD